MMIAPCKDCDRRNPGCHDKCEDYQEFHRKKMELRQKIKDAKDKYYGSLALKKRRRPRNKNGYYV